MRKQEQVAQLEGPVATPEDKVLHLVVRSQWPKALCGYITKEAWNRDRESAGWDRCADCMKIARDEGRAW
jgi:hypothetical protein